MKSNFALLGAALALIAASPALADEAPPIHSKMEKAKAAREKPEAAKPAGKPAAKAEKHEKAQQDKSTVVDREDPCRVDPDLSGCTKETNRSK